MVLKQNILNCSNHLEHQTLHHAQLTQESQIDSEVQLDRPAEKLYVSKAQTPFNFLGQKESSCQILGHFEAL